jgi:hypothetical protein
VRKIEIYQAGSSQHKLRLCVTNVVVHGPGVKLLDGLAETNTNGDATYTYRYRLPLLPQSSTFRARPQFLSVIGLDAGQLGYSLKRRGGRDINKDVAKHPFSGADGVVSSAKCSGLKITPI